MTNRTPRVVSAGIREDCNIIRDRDLSDDRYDYYANSDAAIFSSHEVPAYVDRHVALSVEDEDRYALNAALSEAQNCQWWHAVHNCYNLGCWLMDKHHRAGTMFRRARQSLMDKFGVTEKEAEAILRGDHRPRPKYEFDF